MTLIKRINAFSLLVCVVCSGCTPSAKPTLTDVYVEPNAYRVGSSRYYRVEDLASALKTIPNFDSAFVRSEPNVAQERFLATVKQLKDAGIRVVYVERVVLPSNAVQK